jgi:hypothetical protein
MEPFRFPVYLPFLFVAGQCWLCEEPGARVKVWFRAGEPAVWALACDEHATRLELAS